MFETFEEGAMFSSVPETDMQHAGYYAHNVYNCVFFITISLDNLFILNYYMHYGEMPWIAFYIGSLAVVSYNVIDTVWLLISPKSLKGIHAKITMKSIMTTIIHHIVVIMVASLIMIPQLNEIQRILCFAPYLVEINAFFRDFRKFMNMDKNHPRQVHAYIVCTILFDITWIVMRMIVFLLFVLYQWYVLINDIESIPFWILVICNSMGFLMQLMWTRPWYQKFKLRMCNYYGYYNKYSNAQQIPQTDVSDIDTKIEMVTADDHTDHDDYTDYDDNDHHDK